MSFFSMSEVPGASGTEKRKVNLNDRKMLQEKGILLMENGNLLMAKAQRRPTEMAVNKNTSFC